MDPTGLGYVLLLVAIVDHNNYGCAHCWLSCFRRTVVGSVPRFVHVRPSLLSKLSDGGAGSWQVQTRHVNAADHGRYQ